MAPTGQNRTFKNDEKHQISNIDDLDSASTSISDIKRMKSINEAAVIRPAKCVATATKENDDLNAGETSKINAETTEDGLGDGSRYENLYLPNDDIECLCGVDISSITPQLDCASISTGLGQSSTTKSLKTWKSTGKGRKRKKTKSANKKNHKKHKTDVSMSSANDFVFAEVKMIENNTNEIVYMNCKKTAGDGKHKTSTKGGCIATDQAPGPKANGKICSHVRARRGGGAGDGDDGDDDGGRKPPRKPPEDAPCSKAGKKQKKKKTGDDDMEVGSEDSNGRENKGNTPLEESKDQEMASAVDEQQQNVAQPGPPRQQVQEVKPTEQLVVLLNNSLNHYNFCNKRPGCKRCNRVETTLIQHHFQETNGCCRCAKCRLWLYVLKFHTGICKIRDCKICEKVQPTFPKPAAARVIVQQTPSLDPDEKVVWQDENIKKITHFKEDIHYMMERDSFDKGGHGAIHNVEISDEVKQDLFDSSCRDFVVKKADKVEDDEKSVFEQTWKHPNFVKTYFVVQKMSPKFHHLIFMEKCERSLKDYLKELVKNGKTLEMYEAMFYWSQTLDGLKHLHHLRIPLLHKDIKAENVLLSVNNNMVRVKLADYDTAKRLHHKFTEPGLPPKGTAGLISPEVLRQESHGRPSDIWNMAMFLLQLLFIVDFTKLQLDIDALKYSKDINIFSFIYRTEKLIQEFLDKKIPELRQMDKKLAELIQRCLHDDPLKRPTAIEILQDPAVVKYISMKINMDELIGKICPNLKT